MSRHGPEAPEVDAQGLRFGIVAALYNGKYVDALLTRVLQTLSRSGVAEGDIDVLRVPGSNEVPYAAAMAAKTGDYDCLIALGVVIAGDTNHHEIIGESTAQALHRVGLDWEVPVINGILVVGTEEQARLRCTGDLDRGQEYAWAALHMANLKCQLVQRLDQLEARDTEFAAGEDGVSWDDPLEDTDRDNPWKL